MKQISVEIKQTFPNRKLPLRGRRAAKHCSVYVSFSGATAATTNEVITWTDDKLLGEKNQDQLCHFPLLSLCVTTVYNI